MFDKLEDLLIRYEEIMGELQEPDVVNDQSRFRKLMKEQNDLTPIVEAYKEYKNCKQNIEDSLSLLEEESDEEMKELAKEELSESKKRVEELEQELKILLLPKDPNDDKNVIVEIRAGAGGDEAALFAAEIYRMYVHYADSRRWKTEMISLNENGIGGFKEVVFMITGQGAYSRMKYESGVHRVQRVPETESGGRIHTSTITVAVMPEAEEVDVVIDEKDIRIDVMRASGNGGQCVNTTDSAVRLTHYPTGIVTSIKRRYDLLHWASQDANRYIIEDDYDSEFRLSGKPIPALQSIDQNEKVIYINTFTKSLSSTVRLSYMILPQHLLKKFYDRLRFYSCTVSNFEQYTLARFLSKGYFEKHINRMRTHYKGIRDTFLQALKKSPFASRIKISEEDAGLHFLMYVDTVLTDEALLEKAGKQGLHLACLSQYYASDSSQIPAHTLVLNYSALTQDSVSQAIKLLSRILC